MSKLTKKDVNKCYANWITFSLACQNFERMMGPAFVRMFGLVADKFYSDKNDQQALLKRQSQFFNTEECFGAIVPGIILGMEEKKAEGEDIPDEVITSTKTALMGPLAGIGDSLLGGTLRPLLLSIGLGLAAGGSIVGPLFYSLAWLAIVVPLTYILFHRGYKLGINAVDVILEGNKKDVVIRAANIIGLTVVGAISAQYISVKTGWEYVSGDMTLSLQNILDSILPNFLSLFFVFLAWFLIEKKKMKIGWVFLIFAAIALVGSLVKFMTA